MKETYEDFNDKINSLVRTMMEVVKQERDVSAAHLAGAGMVILASAIDLFPEKERLDLVLNIIPKLLRIADAEAEMVEVHRPNYACH